MAFASRLRRLGERLAKDITPLYHKLDIYFEARWFSIFLNILYLLAITVILTACQQDIVPSGKIDNSTNNPNPSSDSLTLASLQKIDDYPMYMMRYYGDYDIFDVSSSPEKKSMSALPNVSLSDSLWGCTCFASLCESGVKILGRNFDWHYCIPLLLFTSPPNRYASVSIVDLEYFGYNSNNLPDWWENRSRLLETPRLPFDGFNEKGVAVGMMAIPSAKPPYDSRKRTIGELEVMRLILDNAKNLDEAINIFPQYNILMDGPPIHYLISDSSGSSAVIEFIDSKMIVMKNTEPWQVSTNFIIYGSGAPTNVNCWRYRRAYDSLKIAGGCLSNESAMKLLQQVSQSSTIWSVVYQMNSRGINLAVSRKYNTVKTFNLLLNEAFPIIN